jgi:hypothetical protein
MLPCDGIQNPVVKPLPVREPWPRNRDAQGTDNVDPSITQEGTRLCRRELSCSPKKWRMASLKLVH